MVESSRLASAHDLEVLTALGEQARAEMRPKRGGDVLARLDVHASAVDDDGACHHSPALEEVLRCPVTGKGQ